LHRVLGHYFNIMFALKKRQSGRGRGRGKGAKSTSFTLGTKDKMTQAERRIMNEFNKNEVTLDDEIFELWLENPDAPRAYLDMRLAITPHEGFWEGVRFVFKLKFPCDFPNDYPNREPNVNLLDGQKIYHPNINYDGNVCLGYRRQNPWKAAWGIKTVALSLITVLVDPNPDNPQDGCKEIAKIMRDSRTAFRERVAASLRGNTISVDGRSCIFPSMAAMNALGKIPKGAKRLSGKSMNATAS